MTFEPIAAILRWLSGFSISTDLHRGTGQRAAGTNNEAGVYNLVDNPPLLWITPFDRVLLPDGILIYLSCSSIVAPIELKGLHGATCGPFSI